MESASRECLIYAQVSSEAEPSKPGPTKPQTDIPLSAKCRPGTLSNNDPKSHMNSAKVVFPVVACMAAVAILIIARPTGNTLYYTFIHSALAIFIVRILSIRDTQYDAVHSKDFTVDTVPLFINQACLTEQHSFAIQQRQKWASGAVGLIGVLSITLVLAIVTILVAIIKTPQTDFQIAKNKSNPIIHSASLITVAILCWEKMLFASGLHAYEVVARMPGFGYDSPIALANMALWCVLTTYCIVFIGQVVRIKPLDTT